MEKQRTERFKNLIKEKTGIDWKPGIVWDYERAAGFQTLVNDHIKPAQIILKPVDFKKPFGKQRVELVE